MLDVPSERGGAAPAERLPSRIMRPFSAETRAANLTRMAEDRFDVLVIRGGITGTGIALDAVARGLSVALVEKDDFASGPPGGPPG
jgi:glycerol-3-phosphate dehydrogenase